MAGGGEMVDPENLPLNIPCDTLQQNETLRVIKADDAIDRVRKCLEMFVKCIKLGVRVDPTTSTKGGKLMHKHTSKPGVEMDCPTEPVDRMQDPPNCSSVAELTHHHTSNSGDEMNCP